MYIIKMSKRIINILMEVLIMTKKELELFELGNEFNDKVMREFGLDITDDDYLYWMDDNSVITLKERYIKYCEEINPLLGHDEIQLNLLENARLIESLAYVYLKKRINNPIVSISQDVIKGSNRGHFVLSYEKLGKVENLRSDPFLNDSVRVFNLITKINHTEHLYDFSKYDIPIKRDYNK